MCGNEINVGRGGFLFSKVMLNKRCKNVTGFNQVKGEIALKMFLDRKQNFPKRYWIRRMEEGWMLLSTESNIDAKSLFRNHFTLLMFGCQQSLLSSEVGSNTEVWIKKRLKGQNPVNWHGEDIFWFVL